MHCEREGFNRERGIESERNPLKQPFSTQTSELTSLQLFFSANKPVIFLFFPHFLFSFIPITTESILDCFSHRSF